MRSTAELSSNRRYKFSTESFLSVMILIRDFYRRRGVDIAERFTEVRFSECDISPAYRTAFCDGFTLHALLTAMIVTGRLNKSEVARWNDRYKDHRAHTIDAALASRDRLPGFLHVVSEVTLGIGHLTTLDDFAIVKHCRVSS